MSRIASTETPLSPAGGLCKYTNNNNKVVVFCCSRLLLLLNTDQVVMCQVRTQLTIFWKF